MYDIEKTWPKWKIVRLIGEGSFGKVFEIYRNEFGIEEHSALKVVSIPRSDSEVQALKNDGMTDSDTAEYFRGIVSDFVQEIQLMSQLKGSSNVVAYEDFAVVEKADSVGYEILIRMELLTGLPKYLRENRFRVIDVIRLGIDMCRALEVCRELNIVHRDIKPDNIFVSATGSYKLGDFGVARTIEKTMAGLSRKGTYSYMAPEIYNGQEYGFEADIYSLGIVLYKMLNNNRDPFLPLYPAPIKYSDKTEAMVKRIQGLPLPKPTNADEKLTQVILKACAHKIEDRYSHPKELRFDLEAIAAGYLELESEVFSENGINYYTNNSIFGTSTSKPAGNSVGQAVPQIVPSQENAEDIEDGTMVLIEPTDGGIAIAIPEPTDDEGTMVLVEPAENAGAMMTPEPMVDVGAMMMPEPTGDEDAMVMPELIDDEGTMVLTDTEINLVFGTTAIEASEHAATDQVNAVTTMEEAAVQNTAAEELFFVAPMEVACDPVLQCPTCCKPIKEGSLFCGYCGQRLINQKPQPVYCSYCGFEMKFGVKFCGKCGAKI